MDLVALKSDGRVGGIHEVVEEDSYCANILTQVSAVSRALPSPVANFWETIFGTVLRRQVRLGKLKLIKWSDELIDLMHRMHGKATRGRTPSVTNSYCVG